MCNYASTELDVQNRPKHANFKALINNNDSTWSSLLYTRLGRLMVKAGWLTDRPITPTFGVERIIRIWTSTNFILNFIDFFELYSKCFEHHNYVYLWDRQQEKHSNNFTCLSIAPLHNFGSEKCHPYCTFGYGIPTFRGHVTWQRPSQKRYMPVWRELHKMWPLQLL